MMIYHFKGGVKMSFKLYLVNLFIICWPILVGIVLAVIFVEILERKGMVWK